MSEENHRFLIKNKRGGWQIKIIPKAEAQNWILGNPGAILIRFGVALPNGAGLLPCETKEEARAKVVSDGGSVQVIKPKSKIFDNLPDEAIQLMYNA